MQERSLGPEVVRFCPALELYLSPLSRIEITIKLPKFTIPGQSISNWDLMERLKKGVAPIEFCSLRVTESSLEGVTLEADLSTRRIMKQAVKVLETLTVKVSGFSDPVRVHATEAKSEFPSRHDWDLFFMKNKLDESKPGERPDTIYIAKVPIKWFSEKGSDLPSEALLKAAMETFGKVRRVDIPACDEHRKEMDPEISGIKVKGFVFGPELFFEAYVQYEEYSGFVDAMDTLRNMKWTKRIDEKVFHANVKVDFDRSRHLSDANIRRRDAERARINAEKRRLIEEEKRKLAEQEAEARRILEEKEMRREERERKRKEKAEAERLRKEEEKRKREEEERLARERAEARHRAYDERVKESERFLELVFAHIQHKEDRRQKVQEARLRAEQRAAELEDIPISDKEKYLRSMLLRQREIRMREELKNKIRMSADSTSEKGHRHDSHTSSSDSYELPDESKEIPQSYRTKHKSSRTSSPRNRRSRNRARSKDEAEYDAERRRKRRSKDSSYSDSDRDRLSSRRRNRSKESSTDDASPSPSHRRKHKERKKNKKRRRSK